MHGKEEESLITKIILDTATREDFVSVSDSYSGLCKFLSNYEESIFFDFKLEIKFTNTFFDIEEYGANDMSGVRYRICLHKQDYIGEILHYGEELT